MPNGTDRSDMVLEIRQQLSDEEFDQQKAKIDRAERNLEEIKALLTNALYLHNGRLSTGSIDYAAFRVETLSLIFEIAKRTFQSANAPHWYDIFVADLGEEVGLTFARDLIQRLANRNLVNPLHKLRTLLDLWASFENDTGAGVTSITDYTPERIVMQLKNNPLRRSESSPHAHCGFYKSYIASLINELNTSRARMLQDYIHDSIVESHVVSGVEEQYEIEDECVFVVKCRPARLVRSLSLVEKSFHAFYSLDGQEEYRACMTDARAALVSAQREVLQLDADRKLQQMYKVFKGCLSKSDFRRMDSSYQRVSKVLHPERKSKSDLTRAYVWNVLCEVRKVIYAFELLELDEKEVCSLRQQAELVDRMTVLRELAGKAKNLDENEKNQIVHFVSQIQKGEPINEDKQIDFINIVKKIGDKAWDVARPVIADIVTAALKERYHL